MQILQYILTLLYLGNLSTNSRRQRYAQACLCIHDQQYHCLTQQEIAATC